MLSMRFRRSSGPESASFEIAVGLMDDFRE